MVMKEKDGTNMGCVLLPFAVKRGSVRVRACGKVRVPSFYRSEIRIVNEMPY